MYRLKRVIGAWNGMHGQFPYPDDNTYLPYLNVLKASLEQAQSLLIKDKDTLEGVQHLMRVGEAGGGVGLGQGETTEIEEEMFKALDLMKEKDKILDFFTDEYFPQIWPEIWPPKSREV